MFQIDFEGKQIEAEAGANLRRVLKKAECNPHNGPSQWLNCKGMGTCGTCAVEVLEGEVGPFSAQELWRLNFPPHFRENGLRLACQLKVTSNLKIKKHPGFWGEKKS